MRGLSRVVRSVMRIGRVMQIGPVMQNGWMLHVGRMMHVGRGVHIDWMVKVNCRRMDIGCVNRHRIVGRRMGGLQSGESGGWNDYGRRHGRSRESRLAHENLLFSPLAAVNLLFSI